MNGNIKKITVFAVVAAIAMFIAVPTASVPRDYWWERVLIHGEYAFTGSGACTLAPGGFAANFVPNSPDFASMGPNYWEGVYTFKNDGTGKMDALQRYQEGPSNSPNTYGAGLAHLSWEFEYEMDGREITFTYKPGTYYGEYLEGPMKSVILPDTAFFDKPWTGRISPDGRNLYVFYGVPTKLIIEAFGLEIICNGVHQGFKTH